MRLTRHPPAPHALARFGGLRGAPGHRPHRRVQHGVPHRPRRPRRLHPRVPGPPVVASSSGTGAGFQRFFRGETDVQNASRPIREDELNRARPPASSSSSCPSRSTAWPSSPTAATLARVPHRRAAPRRLGAREHARPLERPRPELPGPAPPPLRALPASGTFDYFTTAINGPARQHPRRVQRQRHRQRDRPGRRARPLRDGVLRAGLLRAEPGPAQAHRRGQPDRRRVRDPHRRDHPGRDVPAARAAGVHLRQRQPGRERGRAVRGVLHLERRPVRPAGRLHPVLRRRVCPRPRALPPPDHRDHVRRRRPDGRREPRRAALGMDRDEAAHDAASGAEAPPSGPVDPRDANQPSRCPGTRQPQTVAQPDPRETGVGPTPRNLYRSPARRR
jgi:hypothetical protein